MDDGLRPDIIIDKLLSRELRPVPVPRWQKWLCSSATRLRDLMRRPVLQSRGEQTRLRQFAHHEASIHCLQYLGEGKDGVAVLALIKKKRYTLKLFKKWKPPGPKPYPKEQSIYLSPFANETRCLGLLDSRHKNGTWAVWCHGWMLLTQSQYNQINDVVDISCCTCWVVVKEYLPVPTNRSHKDTIIDNFHIPREARILPQDMRPKNYRASQVVDLGHVLTEPHPEWKNDFSFHWFYENTVQGIASWDFDDEDSHTSSGAVVPPSSRIDNFGCFNVSFYLYLYAFLLPSSVLYLGWNRTVSVGWLRAVNRGLGYCWGALSWVH